MYVDYQKTKVFINDSLAEKYSKIIGGYPDTLTLGCYFDHEFKEDDYDVSDVPPHELTRLAEENMIDEMKVYCALGGKKLEDVL